MITTKILNRNQIDDACTLLYKVHVESEYWTFSSNNPSELRVIEKNGHKLLIDRFTDKAIWFGAFDGDKFIGCTRLTFPDENNQLEVEAYSNSAVIQGYLPRDKALCAESTRTAVSKSYGGYGICKLLLLAAFKYCEHNNYSLVACCNNSWIKSLLAKIGYPLKIEHAFKYEDHDQIPVNFYFAEHSKSEIKNMIVALENSNKKSHLSTAELLRTLEILAPRLPAPIYWHDVNGVVLGLNEHCITGMGAKNKSDIIGKTPYDFYPKEIAEYILKHNQKVIETGETLSQDERIEDITTGKEKYFSNTKSPLYDDMGNIIGIIGTAVDITDRIEKERLELENQIQQAKIEENKKISDLMRNILSLLKGHQIDEVNDKLETLGKDRLPSNNNLSKEISLTKREREILYYLSLDLLPKEIANIIGIVEKNPSYSAITVQTFIEKLYAKFGVNNVGQLLRAANTLGMVPFTLYE